MDTSFALGSGSRERIALTAPSLIATSLLLPPAPPGRPLIGQGAHLGQRLAELLGRDVETSAVVGVEQPAGSAILGRPSALAPMHLQHPRQLGPRKQHVPCPAHPPRLL